MRPRTDGGLPVSIGRLALGLALVATIGCSGASRRPPAAGRPAAHAPTVTTTPRTAIVDLREDPGGFTITHREPVADIDRADYDAALAMIDAGREDAGIALLLAVTERAPTVTAPPIALGVAYARRGELDRAESFLRVALERNPRHPAALNELGLVQRRQGRFEDARATYEAALDAYADFHYAHRNLAILCDLYLGDAVCALEHYEAYARIVPEDPQVPKWIADLRMRAAREDTP